MDRRSRRSEDISRVNRVTHSWRLEGGRRPPTTAGSSVTPYHGRRDDDWETGGRGGGSVQGSGDSVSAAGQGAFSNPFSGTDRVRTAEAGWRREDVTEMKTGPFTGDDDDDDGGGTLYRGRLHGSSRQ